MNRQLPLFDDTELGTRMHPDWLRQANEVWHGCYDYTDSDYQGSKKPIHVFCPKHQCRFRVAMAQNHIMHHNPTGCPICQYEKQHGRDYGPEWRDHLKLSPNNNRVGLIDKPKKSHGQIAAEQRRKEERRRQREAERKAESQQRQEAYRQRLAEQKAETQRRREAERQERQRQREQQEQQRISDLQARFRREAPLAQGEGYIYKGVEQITSTTSLVNVHCPNPDHEWHPMRVDLILQGCKCRECAGRHQSVEQRRDKFLQRAAERYGATLFDLSRVPGQYVNNDTRVEVRCLRHDYWYSVTPDTFLRKSGGCPICNTSQGEMEIQLWLTAHGVSFEREPIWQHHNPRCHREYIKPDFYLEHQQTVIEYNGIQHYEAVAHFKKDKPHWTLADQQERDRTLRDLCRERHLRLLEIPYTDFDRIGDILTENLLKKPLSEHETAFLSEK